MSKDQLQSKIQEAEEQKKLNSLIEKYMSNPRLKKAGAKSYLTKKQVAEFVKCSEDPIYFMERYVKIINIDDGLIPIRLYPKQKEMITLAHNNRKTIVKAARQVGKTTTLAVGYLLHYVLFNSDKMVAILANKELTATEILARLKIAYLNLPLWIQQGVEEWNKTSIVLENGSKVISGSTSSSAIRGMSINLLYLDEFAFVPPNIAGDFFTSVYPTISSGKTSKIIITSTPNGLNLFYKLCMDAINKRSDFVIGEYDWTVVPWRDKAWEKDQRQTLGEEKFEQEYECHFLGSSGTLISGKVLRSLAFRDALQNALEDKMQIYTLPEPGKSYILIADSSHGKELDYSAFVIIDVSVTPYKIVAKYRNNDISAQLYPNVICSAAKMYNQAFVLGENNDIGSQVLYILNSDLEYENMIYTEDDKNEKKVTSGNKTLGIRTTPKVKRQGCNALKTLIENYELLIDDFHIIEELSTFVIRPNKTYAADEDKHDDLVMCLVLFSWLTTQQYFKDLTDQDSRHRIFDKQMEEIDDELPPAPRATRAPDLLQNTFIEDGVIWEIAANNQLDESDHAFGGKWTGY